MEEYGLEMAGIGQEAAEPEQPAVPADGDGTEPSGDSQAEREAAEREELPQTEPPAADAREGEAPADFWNRLSRETGVPAGQLLRGVWKGAEERSGAGSQEARRDPAHASDGKQSEQKRDADIRGLLREFPDIQAKEIHQEVWDEVRRGGTLLEAYRNWTARHLREENQRLKASMSAGPANLRNRSRSVGPQRTSGRDTGRDAFLEALLGGDGL